jgi:hypothetical protein
VETFVTVIVILALIALGAFLIHRLNSQHSDRITAFHYGRSGAPLQGPGPSAPRGAGGRHHGGHRRLRRRTRKGPG